MNGAKQAKEDIIALAPAEDHSSKCWSREPR